MICLQGLIVRRGRYCKYCDAYVNGFDHHCPAFGNCIGNNDFPGSSDTLSGRWNYCNHHTLSSNWIDNCNEKWCPCAGQKNHFLFVLIITGFVISEASYVACASLYKFVVSALLMYQITKNTFMKRWFEYLTIWKEGVLEKN